MSGESHRRRAAVRRRVAPVFVLAIASGCADADGPRGIGPGTEADRDDLAPACAHVRSWNRQAGSANPQFFWLETATAAAATSDGGVTVLGRVLGAGASATFGTHSVASDPQDYYPGVITRLDRSGNFLWAQGMSDGDLNGLGDIASGGGVTAVANSMNVGNQIGDVVTLALPHPDPTQNVIGDVFLGALDDDGEVLWTRTLGGTDSSDYVYGLVVDDLGEITIVVWRLVHSGPDEAQILHFDRDGNVEWQVASTSVINDLRLAHDGSLLVTGGIVTPSGTATVARLDPDDGSTIWSAGDASVEPMPAFVAEAPGGEVAVLTRFSGAVTLGGQSFTASGGADLAITRWDADGFLDHAWSFGGTSAEFVDAFEIDGRGTHVVGVGFNGATAAGDEAFTSAGSYDAAIVTFDADGEVIDLLPVATGPGFGALRDLVVTGDDDLYAVGTWRGTSELGTSVGGDDMFIGRVRCADEAAPLRVRDVTAVRRTGAVDRTEYFCAQSQDAWNNCQAVYLVGATGSTYDYTGAAYDGHLMVGHTFGAVAGAPYSAEIDYVDADGNRERITAWFPAFTTAAGNGKMVFYVADDGSTYYADAEHDGYHFAAEVLTPAQAIVPAHLARARP